ncbi:unnamed protein product, partial [Rotaria magnacalcarata]
DKIT